MPAGAAVNAKVTLIWDAGRRSAGYTFPVRIGAVRALEVLDSRGMPTLKVTAEVDGRAGSFYVPAGASTGKAEVKELRDGGARYGGKGVRKAAAQVAALGRELRKRDVAD